MKEEIIKDKVYMLRKLAVMLTCMVTFITVGLVIINFQAKMVTINYYGQEIHISTMSNTVEGLLMQNGIYVDEKAVIYPSVDTRLEDNMHISIYTEEMSAELNIDEYIENAKNNIREVYLDENQVVEFDMIEQSNANVDRGAIKTLQAGSAGEKNVKYTVKYIEDKEIARNIIEEVVLKEVENQVIEVGTSVSTVSRSSINRVTAKDFAVDSGFVLYNIKLSADLQRYAYNMCKKYNIPYETFLAVMYVESGFNNNSISSTNDYGICQINMCNYNYLNRNLGITDLLNPYDNIKAGAFWLSRYYKSWSKYNSGELLERNALNSYNFGEAGYRQYINQGGTAYSWRYANKVLDVKAKLIENGGL
ncbi:MAG: transglycosylase SLT domain-containing protein [Clostridia bacterium]|nr:transglycosylase SLT domain-containing protein [Clostridia bacterium]